MKRSILLKLVGIWFLLLLSVPIIIGLLQRDLIISGGNGLPIKLLFMTGVIVAGSIRATYKILQSSPPITEPLERFIAALPMGEMPLPDVPPELERLSRVTKAMAGRVRNLVERANLETARRETVLACMAEGVLATDKNLNVIFCNEAFARAFNARVPVPEGRTLYEVAREPLLREILDRVIKAQTPHVDRFRLPSAAGRWFEARALPYGQAGREGAVLVLHDVTDLQRQEQLRKDFVADVSHELRTPLAAIRGYAETLLDGALDDKNVNRRFTEIILSHATRLNHIAADLLVLSELDSGDKPAMPPERVAIREAVNSAVSTVRSAAEAGNVRIDITGCQECTVWGYQFRVEQVLINLIDNAVKFNRAGGEVRIACEYENHENVLLTISDTGIGIPSEDLKRIFERFYRVDKARARPAGGTGLGLPIVKEVVERLGGSVDVDSQLGRGSRFMIKLPAGR